METYLSTGYGQSLGLIHLLAFAGMGLQQGQFVYSGLLETTFVCGSSYTTVDARHSLIPRDLLDVVPSDQSPVALVDCCHLRTLREAVDMRQLCGPYPGPEMVKWYVPAIVELYLVSPHPHCRTI